MGTPTNDGKLAVEPPKRKERARKIRMCDIEGIVERMVEFGMTESEACHDLKIRPKQWFNFKNRDKVKVEFEESISRVRGLSLKNGVSRIKEAGEDWHDGKFTRRGDWRATAWHMENIVAADRLGDRRNASEPPLTLNINLGEAIKRAYATVECPPAAKQIESGNANSDLTSKTDLLA